jgi:hypothetical protein
MRLVLTLLYMSCIEIPYLSTMRWVAGGGGWIGGWCDRRAKAYCSSKLAQLDKRRSEKG